MAEVFVVGPRDKGKYPTGNVVMTVSRSDNWSRGLSPFVLGPCQLYGGNVAQNVENAWQFAKVYKRHVDSNGDPTQEYFEWRDRGWLDFKAHRYPMGKGAIPEYSYWDGEHLGYIDAKRKIYIPLYYRAVKDSSAFQTLKILFECEDEDLYLWDYDGYNHKARGMTYDDVVHCENMKMGHAFVLYGMLTGEISPYIT